MHPWLLCAAVLSTLLAINPANTWERDNGSRSVLVSLRHILVPSQLWGMDDPGKLLSLFQKLLNKQNLWSFRMLQQPVPPTSTTVDLSSMLHYNPIGGRTASKTTTKNNHRTTTKHTPTTIPMEQTETRNDPVEKEIKYISKINLLNRHFKCIKILSCFA